MNWDSFLWGATLVCIGLLVGSVAVYSAYQWDYTKLDQLRERILQENGELANQTQKMCSLACNQTVRFQYARGMAYDGYAVIRMDNVDISDALNTCAHEWAHAHEGLRDS